MDKNSYTSWQTTHVRGDKVESKEDVVAVEFPLTLIVNQKEFATIICTPTYLRELTIGFLASEGIILLQSEIKSLQIDQSKGFVYIDLHKELEPDYLNSSQRFIGSCCGKSRQFYFKSDVRTSRTVMHDVSITTKQCLLLMDALQNHSIVSKHTGGVHNTALCTTDTLLEIRTDIGRHNTLDKLYGYMIENRLHPKDKVIVFSGRVSSEVLLKVSKMNISIIISAAAPTNLALQLAKELNITVVGFTRETRMNVYTHKKRIIDI